MLFFEWDEKKNLINQRKHGIRFEDVESVFYDDHALLFDDPEHSIDEERFLLLGMSETKGVCLVCHCYRKQESVVRIISARRATRREEEYYVRGI